MDGWKNEMVFLTDQGAYDVGRGVCAYMMDGEDGGGDPAYDVVWGVLMWCMTAGCLGV